MIPKRTLLALLLIPNCAFADLQHLPKWHMVNDQACYTFDQAKQLVVADAELEACTKQLAALPQLQKAHEEALAAIAKKDVELKLVLDTATQLRGKLNTCVDERAKAEAAAARGPGVGWLVAGGAVLALLGYVLGTQLH